MVIPLLPIVFGMIFAAAILANAWLPSEPADATCSVLSARQAGTNWVVEATCKLPTGEDQTGSGIYSQSPPKTFTGGVRRGRLGVWPLEKKPRALR